MTLPGNLDFMGQSAQTARFIGALAVDSVGSQSIDLSSLIAPNDQALLLYWVATGGFSGLPCGVIAQTNAPPIFFTGHTQIADNGSALLSIAGQLVTGSVNAGMTLLVDNIGPGAIHIAGTIYAFALTTLPLSIPVQRRYYIGQGLATGQITVAATTTATILGAPSAGLYYRIKTIGFTTVAAPGAAGRVSVRNLASHLILWSFVVPAAANQTFQISMDWESDEGLEVVNGLPSGAPMTCMYELWQA